MKLTSGDRKTFADLRKATEMALLEAEARADSFDEAVNWDDLRCAMVTRRYNELGEETWRVDIDGVMPGTSQFQEWLGNRIKVMTGIRPEIVTDW